MAGRSRIADYELELEVGSGAVGIVYRACSRDGRVVALKLLRPEHANDASFRGRLARELRVARDVRDPHLVAVVDTGEFEGRPYLVSEYLTGGSLGDRLRLGTLSVEQMARLVAEVAAGLDALHRRNLVHRDIKPSNILFREDGSAALGDFGLAKAATDTMLTEPGAVLGTLDYLAPELLRGADASPASDIYALGCVAFECLAGRPPFADRSLLGIATAQLEDAPPDPPAPPEVAWAVLRALDKDPASRPVSATMYSHLLRAATRP